MLRSPLPPALLAALAAFLPGRAEPQEPGGAEPLEAPPGPAVAESSVCALCHSNAPAAGAMRTPDGSGVAPVDLWRATAMANSARDPLWRAFVSAEVDATPSRRAEIEETCLSCHAPLAHRAGLDDHGTGSLLHALDCDGELGGLARDGVSCTICHGMAPDGLGAPDTYSGAFELDPYRRLFGPHEAPFAHPMRMHTGFTPTAGDHVLSSELCASCHTLETPVYAADGATDGAVFLEQAPYLEWRNSAFSESGERAATCQECHVPRSEPGGAPLATRIARNPGGRDFPPLSPRRPYGLHTFLGGNTLLLGLLRDHGEELGAVAPPEAFDAMVEATRAQLAERAARVSIASLEREAGVLRFEVRVENVTGHKLPTGHPTRRAWLRVHVADAEGRTLFVSGAVDDAGRIVDGAGRPLPSELAGGPVEPHRDLVRTADEVALYEAVPADREGRPTHTLLRAASWYLDGRLLPAGWRADGPDADRTSPVGVAGDADFAAGEDRVRYEIELDVPGPLTAEVDLLFQSLGARWAAELFRHETPEVATFRRLYADADRTPEVLARMRRTL